MTANMGNKHLRCYSSLAKCADHQVVLFNVIDIENTRIVSNYKYLRNDKQVTPDANLPSSEVSADMVDPRATVGTTGDAETDISGAVTINGRVA